MAEAKKEKTKSESEKEFQGLYRSETNRVIAGVSGGLGEYFNVDATIIRVLFILMTVFGGSGLIIYLVLWLIIPSKSGSPKDSKDAIRSNLEDMKTTTQTFAHNISKPSKDGKDKQSLRSDDLNSRFWWALFIIIAGFFFLLNNYGLLEIDLEKLWPVVLIIFGLAIILRK